MNGRVRNLLLAAAACALASCGSGPEPATTATTTTTPSKPGDAVVVTGALIPLAPPAQLQPGVRPAETFPARDLIGLTLHDLRERMGRGALPGDISPMLVVRQDNGPPLSFLLLDDALADSWVAARMRLGGGAIPHTWTACTTAFGPAITTEAGAAGRALLIFRGEVLSEIRHPQNIRRAPEERPGGRPSATPREHVFLTEPGQLPLADGSGFLRRWHSPPVSANDQITVRCEVRQPTQTPQPSRSSVGFSASDMQALALAPLAVFMPGINADRRAALSEGPATAALLQLGQPVPGGAANFDKDHKRAWFYPGKDGYGVMAIDMGMVPNNNLSDRGAMVFAGVRNDRVEWIAQEGSGVGFPPMMMCLDEDFVVGKVRKGCTEYGHFNPVR